MARPNESHAPNTPAFPQLNPGDQAPQGTIGTGEDTCPVCKGKGRLDDGDCQNCGGTGCIIEAIGGA